ncbi:MAG: tRNA1(Val) (adenine(37)-N6)-methyltransferase [Clostridia bacterium]
MNIKLKENERIDDLEFNNLKIIQNEKEFCFGMDAVLLSDFAKDIKQNSKIIDFGTGTGILPILLSGKTENTEIYGVEIQEKMAEMATRSVKLNRLENRIKIINEDIKNLKNIFKKNTFDVVITNPPYKINNTGLKNENEGKLISRHEVKCNLEDIIISAKDMLKDKGVFYMVHRPERIVDICELLRKYKIEPKIIRFVYPKKEKEANLVLIKSVKNARKFLKIEKPLIIYEENGDYKEEIFKIYNKKQT